MQRLTPEASQQDTSSSRYLAEGTHNSVQPALCTKWQNDGPCTPYKHPPRHNERHKDLAAPRHSCSTLSMQSRQNHPSPCADTSGRGHPIGTLAKQMHEPPPPHTAPIARSAAPVWPLAWVCFCKVGVKLLRKAWRAMATPGSQPCDG